MHCGALRDGGGTLSARLSALSFTSLRSRPGVRQAFLGRAADAWNARRVRLRALPDGLANSASISTVKLCGARWISSAPRFLAG
jgi:hypothetical protein